MCTVVLMLLFGICDRQTASPLQFWKNPVTWSVTSSGIRDEATSSISICLLFFFFLLFSFFVLFWCWRSNLRLQVERENPETPDHILNPEFYFLRQCSGSCFVFSIFYQTTHSFTYFWLWTVVLFSVISQSTANFWETLYKGYYEAKIL